MTNIVMPWGLANDIWVGHRGPVCPRGQWTFASEEAWRKINQLQKSYRGLANDNGWWRGHRECWHFIGCYIPHLFVLNTHALLFCWLLLLWRWTLSFILLIKSLKLLYPDLCYFVDLPSKTFLKELVLIILFTWDPCHWRTELWVKYNYSGWILKYLGLIG